VNWSRRSEVTRDRAGVVEGRVVQPPSPSRVKLKIRGTWLLLKVDELILESPVFSLKNVDVTHSFIVLDFELFLFIFDFLKRLAQCH
jgi:hypothetical protein